MQSDGAVAVAVTQGRCWRESRDGSEVAKQKTTEAEPDEISQVVEEERGTVMLGAVLRIEDKLAEENSSGVGSGNRSE